MKTGDRDGRFTLIVALVAGALALVLALVGTSRYGIAMHSDGLAYVSAAESLAEGRGLVIFDGRPLAGWPPLYPALLSALMWAGADGGTAAVWLGALSFAGVVTGTLLLARSARLGRLETLFIGASLLLGVTMLDRWRSAMSEPPFMVLVLVCLGALHRHLRDGRNSSLALATATAGLSCLTRYAGLGLVLVGGLVLLLDHRRSAAERLVRAFVFGAGALLMSAPWIVRNVRVTGWPTGVPPVEASGSLGESATGIAVTLGRWFVPGWLPDLAAVLVAVLLLALATIALFSGARQAASRDDIAERGRSLLVAGAFSLGFTAFLVASTAGVFIDSDLSRLLSPVLPTLTIVVATIVTEWRERFAIAAPRLAVAGTLAFLLAWPARYTSSAYASLLRNGAGGYATQRWQESQLARAAGALGLASPVYSNEAGALFVLAGVRALQLPAHHHPNGAPTADSALQIVSARLGKHPVPVVLFAEPTLERYRYTESDLRAVFHVQVVERLSDGAVYHIGARAPTSIGTASPSGAAH